MNTQPEALRLADLIDERPDAPLVVKAAAAELRRLLELAQEQHTVIYGLRLQVGHLEHNNRVLTSAIWKACGDDEQVVNDTIESQGTLR